MSELSNFLLENTISDLTEEVELTGRLKGKKFRIKVATADEYAQYVKVCQKIIPGKKEFQMDADRFRLLLLKNHVVEPCFTDAKLLEEAKCNTPEQFINSRLLIGEQSVLQEAILTLSGFNTDLKEDIEVAKN